MAVTEPDTDDPTEQIHHIDLRDLGAERLPEAVATCEVTVVGDVDASAQLQIEIVDTTWVVDVVLATGELEGVYDSEGPTSKPETMPDWLEPVCQTVGVTEVAL
ncbi:hypothetical protein [Natrinema ejinorense]|uniref:Uncharacterized protein n=1 Tax=Natrinema ejinorense TaxID=373386 RepID=A0A2A5QPB6_9EURY|nr:hypothetical protein [Natrinema ejinorense]PCR88672.1 hypothetical protein CP557_21830 [Natrinema ejinorense]